MLSIGKRYFLLTKSKTITGKRIHIVGLLNYEEAKKIPYDIGILAINERVIPEASIVTTEAYFKDKYFYWCKSIDTDDNSQYVIWDDIIDMVNTTMLNAEFDYKLSLIIGTDVDFTANSIIEFIKSTIAQQYGSKVLVNMDTIGYDMSKMTDKEIFQDQLKDYKALLDSLRNLQPLTSTLNKLIGLDISSVYDKINKQMTDINANIGAIASNLR